MRRKRRIIIIMMLFVMVSLVRFSVSKYKTMITGNGSATIAEPIIILEKNNVINTEYNKKTGTLEYIFNIKKYTSDKVNEVDCVYNIEVIENNKNFPIAFKLIDLSNNEVITLTNNKSIDFVMGSSIKDEDKYKLEITWLDKNVKYSDSLQLSLKTNIIQVNN